MWRSMEPGQIYNEIANPLEKFYQRVWGIEERRVEESTNDKQYNRNQDNNSQLRRIIRINRYVVVIVVVVVVVAAI